MGNSIEGIILGLIQGLTEFLPVSSSGHLEIAKYIFGDDSVGSESLLMTIVLHLGTAIATLYVFRNDVVEIIKGIFSNNKDDRDFALKIILSMIPAVIVGVVFEDAIDGLFNQNILLVCVMLLVTGGLLFLADRAKESNKKVSFINALIIGVSQAIAIMPGISRSGATISTSVLLGIDKEKSARFSFLMVVPLIFGKIAKDVLDGEFNLAQTELQGLILGFITATLVGVFACKLMINIVKKSKLEYFSYYCFVVGIFGIIYFIAFK